MAEETAQSLGHAGRKVEHALAAHHNAYPDDRAFLRKAAAEAVYNLIVQLAQEFAKMSILRNEEPS